MFYLVLFYSVLEMWKTQEGSLSHSGYCPLFLILHHLLLLSLFTINIFTLEFELYANQLAELTNAQLLDNIYFSCDDFFWYPSFSSSPSLFSPDQWRIYLSFWGASFHWATNQLPDGRLASCVNCRGNWVRRRSLIELIRGQEWKQMEGNVRGEGRWRMVYSALWVCISPVRNNITMMKGGSFPSGVTVIM